MTFLTRLPWKRRNPRVRKARQLTSHRYPTRESSQGDTVLDLHDAARLIQVDRKIAQYIVALVNATRSHTSLKMGSSPRGTLALFRTTQARALLEGRDYAIPEDVKAMAIPVLAHRLALDTKAKYTGLAKEDILREVLGQVPVGV